MIDPDLVAYMQKRAQPSPRPFVALAPPVAAIPDALPAESALPSGPQVPDAALPALPATEPAPDPIRELMQQHVERYGPEALQRAQDQDVRDYVQNRYGRTMAGAARLISGAPVQAPDEAKPYRTENLLRTRGVAREDLQTQTQMLAMDPGSVQSRVKVQMVRGLGINVPDGFSGYQVDMVLEAMKAGASAQEAIAKVGNVGADTKLKIATTEKTGAEAQGALAANAPVPDNVRQALAAKGVIIPAGTPMSQLDKYTGPQVTIREGEANRKSEMDRAQLAQGGEWKRLVFGKEADLAKWRAEHPSEISPGFTYTGPGVVPDKAREEFQAAHESATKLDRLLGEYKDILDRSSRAKRFVGDDAARLGVVHGQLMAEARSLMGARTLTDSDIKLANGLTPGPDLFTRKSSYDAAIEKLRASNAAGLAEKGKSHFITPTGGKDTGGSSAPDAAALDHYKAQLQPGERLAIGPGGAAKALGPNDPVPAGFSLVP